MYSYFDHWYFLSVIDDVRCCLHVKQRTIFHHLVLIYCNFFIILSRLTLIILQKHFWNSAFYLNAI